MTTQSIQWERCNETSMNGASGQLASLFHLMDRAMSFFAAAFTACVTITGAVWIVSNPDLVVYLQATTWTAGLLFAGVAIEAEKPSTSALALATGVTLPVMAFVSQHLGPEWLIVAAAVTAAWLAAAVYRFSRIASR